MRILIIEDNRNLVHGLRHNLELEGHLVDAAFTGAAGLERARSRDVHLILLDLMIPAPDGFQVLRTLREEGIETPVIVLTARGRGADKVRGLRLGADDYVTKPFGLLELLARVDAVRRGCGWRPGRWTPARSVSATSWWIRPHAPCTGPARRSRFGPRSSTCCSRWRRRGATWCRATICSRRYGATTPRW